MKTLANLAFAAAASAAMLAVPVAAETKDGIVVTQSSRMTAWKADMKQQLDRQLIRSDGFRDRAPMTAVVQIRFTLDADGKPTNLKTIHHTGARRADNASRYAVRNLRGFDKAPLADPRGVTYQANLIFARNDAEGDKLRAQLAEVERQRLAANDDETIVMLGG